MRSVFDQLVRFLATGRLVMRGKENSLETKMGGNENPFSPETSDDETHTPERPREEGPTDQTSARVCQINLGLSELLGSLRG